MWVHSPRLDNSVESRRLESGDKIMASITNQKLVVKCPPDYDGELHIHTQTVQDNLGSIVTITIQVRTLPSETVQSTVRRVGQDMQRAK